MTFALKAGVALACLLFIYWQASYQSNLFRKQQTINHFSKGILYFLFVLLVDAVMMWGRWNDWQHEQRLWGIPLIGLVTRVAFFDPILNRLRKLSWWYNGATKSYGSLIDRWENSLSASWVKVAKIAYIILFITVLIVL